MRALRQPIYFYSTVSFLPLWICVCCFSFFLFFHTSSLPISIRRITFFSVSGPQAKKTQSQRERESERSTNCSVVRLTPGTILSRLAGSLLLLHTIWLLLLVRVIINFYSFCFAIGWMCLFFAEIHVHAAMNGRTSQWARADTHSAYKLIIIPPVKLRARTKTKRIVIEEKKWKPHINI